jgi:Glycosyl hydrolases family 18
MLPLLTEETGTTHVILAAIHLNSPPGYITLNDDPYNAPKFTELWDEARILQAHGIKIMGMLGGAARGSFLKLDGSAAAFEAFYQPLREMILWSQLEGLDLDVEEAMSLGGIIRLVDRLRHDFGPEFIITLTPVAPGMRGEQNLHGFDMEILEKGLGRHISWYNTQFYCGWVSELPVEVSSITASFPVRNCIKYSFTRSTIRVMPTCLTAWSHIYNSVLIYYRAIWGPWMTMRGF